MYSEAFMSGALVRKSGAHDTAEVLTAAAAVYGGYIVLKQCKIKRLMFVVTTLVASDTVAAVVEFNRRPTIDSSSGEVLLGQLTIPDGSAVGAVIYKDIEPVTLVPGDELSLEHVTAATDGTAAAGAGFYGFELCDEPEQPANCSNMVASA